MSEREQIDGFNGGLVEGWSFGGSLTHKFKESTSSTTEVILPKSIKLVLFSSRTRSFRIKLEFHDGFIEIPLSMDRLEGWEKEIHRLTALECEEEEKDENVDINN